jgi:hypothetical protein
MSAQPVNKKPNTLLIVFAVVAGVTVLICFGCLFLSVLGNLSSNTGQPSSFQVLTPTVAQGDSAPTESREATNEIRPTKTSVPTRTPRPTSTPVLGATRDNPVPIGLSVNLGNMTVTITNVTRPADGIVESGNMFNAEPEANQEYLMIEMQVICNKSSSDKCYFSPYDFKAVGLDGNLRDPEIFIAGVDGMLETGEFFGGGIMEGKIFYLVAQGDDAVVIYYEPLFSDGIFFGLK